MSTILHDEFLFIHIPKTAGTFVTDFIRKSSISNGICKSLGRAHKPYSAFSNIDDKYVFSCIRDPFHWYVSFYLANWNGAVDDVCGVGCSFKSFVKAVNSGSGNVKNVGRLGKILELDCGFYTLWLLHMCGNKNYQQKVFNFARVENLRNDLHFIFNEIGVNMTKEDLLLLKKMSKKRVATDSIKLYNDNSIKLYSKYYDNEIKLYSKYYDNEIREIIVDRDKMIFEQFNYDME